MTINGHTTQGRGPNKKLAKRVAAESLLRDLGYYKPAPVPGKPALKSTTTTAAAESSTKDSAASLEDTSISKTTEKTKKVGH